MGCELHWQLYWKVYYIEIILEIMILTLYSAWDGVQTKNTTPNYKSPTCLEKMSYYTISAGITAKLYYCL